MYGRANRRLLQSDGVRKHMQNVIITGADGFVGSNVADYFLSQDIKVLAIGRKDKPQRLVPHKNLVYLQCDVSDGERMLREIPVGIYDTLLHFAWTGSAGEARMDYRLQMQNALNSVELLKVSKKLGCRRFVGAGSIMEYEIEAAVHSQGSRPGMAYIYGMGKHVAHSMCKSVAADIDMEFVWPMITNAYGVGERSPRFVNTTLRKIINGEQLQFTSATQNYDFIYITDVARAFYLIAENGKAFCEYIIGSGNARPLKEFIMEMQQALAPNMTPAFGSVPFTGTNIPLNVFDTKATEEDCGFSAEISFAEGAGMTMKWLQEDDKRRADHGTEV